jgi:hypothetical protein
MNAGLVILAVVGVLMVLDIIAIGLAVAASERDEVTR